MVKICFISNINVLDGEFAFWDKEKCSAFPLEINTFHHHPDLSTTGGGGRAIKNNNNKNNKQSRTYVHTRTKPI